MQKKGSSKLMWYVIGGLAVFIVAWVLTAPSDTSGAAKKKMPAKKGGLATEDQFTEADYNAHFPSLGTPAGKNSFKPLVYRKDAASRAGETQLNAVPSDFAGGDGNWLYTGTGEVDGVPEALFENKSTGEGVFVQHGAHWKNAVVEHITPTTVLLSGPSGTKLLQLVNPEPTEAPGTTSTTTTPATSGTAPVMPPIRGPIGNTAGGGGTTGGTIIGG